MIVEVIVLAALTAAFIQAWRKPEGAPAPVAAGKTAAEQFILTMHAAEQSPFPRQVEVTEAQVNQYLTSTIKVQTAGFLADYVSCDRVFVMFGSGSFDAGLQETVLKHSFYLRVRYVVVKRNNGQNVEAVGAWLGRLPIYPLALDIIERAIAPAWGGAGSDLQLLASASQVVITPEKALLNFAGKHLNY